MKTVTVHKADSFPHRPQDPEGVVIEVTAVQPEHPRETYAQDAEALFMTDAHVIHNALKASLPGGTLDHLFAVMAADRASIRRSPRP